MIIGNIHLNHPLLKESFEAAPGITVEVEQEAALDAAEPLLWFRAFDASSNGDPGISGYLAAFDAALEADDTVEDSRVMNEIDGTHLYRIRCAEGTTYPKWVTLDAVLLEATGTNDGWEVRLGFPDREAARAYWQHCREEGFHPTVLGLHEEGSAGDTRVGSAGLTDAQRVTLELAFSQGFFDIPRAVSHVELADQLGISDQAVSERLRRGMKNLLATRFCDQAISA